MLRVSLRRRSWCTPASFLQRLRGEHGPPQRRSHFTTRAVHSAGAQKQGPTSPGLQALEGHSSLPVGPAATPHAPHLRAPPSGTPSPCCASTTSRPLWGGQASCHSTNTAGAMGTAPQLRGGWDLPAATEEPRCPADESESQPDSPARRGVGRPSEMGRTCPEHLGSEGRRCPPAGKGDPPGLSRPVITAASGGHGGLYSTDSASQCSGLSAPLRIFNAHE